MHQSSFHIIARFRELVEKNYPQSGIRILDVGSYGVNGTYKEIFSDTVRYHYTGLDVSAGPNVDYVPADPYNWPELTDESFDVIISGQAFEHIEHPWLIMEEMSRVLKRNGLVCIVAPSPDPEHKYPVDCWRYYPDGFRALAKWVNLQVIDSKTNWGKSGFNDGSDQWGDSFCILYKPENQIKKDKQRKRDAKSLVAFNSNNPLRQSKQISYYGFARPEVIAAVNKNRLPTAKILEIGCAGGATGKALKEKLPVQSYVGIDISEEAAAIAQKHLDKVIVANIEETDLSVEHGLRLNDFDLLLALDVLEHLSNPWDILAELSSYVKPGGFVVASLPNVQNITIVQDLISGKWQYQDAGILDATHLRFFTLESAKKMFSGAGLNIKGVENVINPSLDIKTLKESGNKYRYANVEIDNLTKQELIDLFTYQYIIIAQKPDSAGNFVASGAENCKLISGNDQINTHFEHDKSENKLTSLVILTCNELEYTKKCVKSLHRHTPEPHEVIFVDNGSTDGTVKWLREQAERNKNYRLIENRKNLGFAKGCNQGIEASQGEFIVLLNNDTVVSEDWLGGMLECLVIAPNAGIVGPMTNNISGIQQVNDGEYGSVDYLNKCATKFRERYRHRRIPLRRIVGFCMLFRRSLVETIGFLDESFGTGNFEDDDFCLRAELAGYKNYLAGQVFIHHYGSRSFIGNRIDFGAAMTGNRKIIDEKWTLSTSTEEGKVLFLLRTTETANEFYQKGDTDQAIEALVNCIKLTPDAKEIYHALMRMFIEIKRFGEAWAVMETLPEAAKGEPETLEHAAYIKEGLNLDDEAAAIADKILSSDGTNASALNLKGVLAYKKDDKERAQEYFQKAIDSDPGYGEAYANLGVAFWGQGNKEEGFKNLQKGFVLSPQVPDISSLYYSVVSSLGRYSLAEADYQEAARLYPSNKNIAFLLIDILIQQGKLNDAIREIQDALALFGLDEGTLNAALSIRETIGPLEIDRSVKRGTLSLCMIVKNEEKHLVRCLMSVRDVVDEMIIVDTGSTDRTRDIASIFGAKVFDFPWTGDFSEARNHSLSQASGEWILVLDADESVSQLDLRDLRTLVRKTNSQAQAYSIVTRNYTKNFSAMGWTPNRGEYPDEVGLGWVASNKVRLFKQRKDISFSNPVHEVLEDSLKKAKIAIHTSNIVVHHYGRLDTNRDLQKGEDYYVLGKQKYESDPTNVKYINELAKQAQALQKYEEAINLWQKLLARVERPNSPEYTEVAAISSGEPIAEVYTQLASAYMMLGRYDEALITARRAIEIDAKRNESIHICAYCEIIAGSLDQAALVLESLYRAVPDYPSALFLLVVVFCLEGRDKEAAELFQSLLHKGIQITSGLNKIVGQLHAYGKRHDAFLLVNAMIKGKMDNEETTSVLEALQENPRLRPTLYLSAGT